MTLKEARIQLALGSLVKVYVNPLFTFSNSMNKKWRQQRKYNEIRVCLGRTVKDAIDRARRRWSRKYFSRGETK